MKKSVWLINLFGNPCAPSAFNPDNSLAALAGNLKAANYAPLIIDLQTVSVCSELYPKESGQIAWQIVQMAQRGQLNKDDLKFISHFNEKLTKHQFQVIDSIAESLINQAKKNMPLFIGMKIYSGDGSSLSRRLAIKLKKALKIPLLAGGPLIRTLEKKYFELYNEFDYLIDGEADRSIVKFAKFIDGDLDSAQVPGLIYHISPGKIVSNPVDVIHNMEELPDPCYDKDVYPALYEENEKTLVFQLDESRGCPNKCHFCIHPVINGRGMRMMPAQRIIQQIKNLQQEFGAVAFRFTGSNTPRKFLRQFAELVAKENLKIQYSCFASVNTADVSLVKPLKESGLTGVFIGVETLDQGVLKDICNKHGQSREKIETVLKAFLDNGIYTTTSWIYPMPGVTEAIRQETKSFIIDIYKGRSEEDGSAILVPSALIPRTEWFINAKTFNFEIPDLDNFYRGYAELSMRLFLPRQLMGSWGFTMDGRPFENLAAECDKLERELEQEKICLGISDEWMLAGKLSGYGMKEFREKITEYFVKADYNEIRNIVDRINKNSATLCREQQKVAI